MDKRDRIPQHEGVDVVRAFGGDEGATQARRSQAERRRFIICEPFEARDMSLRLSHQITEVGGRPPGADLRVADVDQVILQDSFARECDFPPMLATDETCWIGLTQRH